jgi:hypothetical protein
MEPRLASSVLVGALIRKAEAEGGFAAVLERGDSSAGAILLILLERGANPRLFERILQPDGRYVWRGDSGEASEKSADVPSLVAHRRRFDPDLWVLELDIPSVERFAAEMTAID